MKRILLHLINWVGCCLVGSMGGKLVGQLMSYLFRGFLNDGAYAEAHPKKYLLGAFGIVVLTIVAAYILISMPLKWVMDKIDAKIEKFADDKEWD